MSELDVFPATVRGPLTTTSSKVVTFARVFTHEGRFYIAESTGRGGRVRSVTEYPVPDGELERGRGKSATWGPWSWSSCGCASGWRSHSIDSLVAQAAPLPTPEPDPADDSDVLGDHEDTEDQE